MIFFATLYLLIANKIKLTRSTFGGKHVWMADLKSSKTCHLGPAKWGKHTFFFALSNHRSVRSDCTRFHGWNFPHWFDLLEPWSHFLFILTRRDFFRQIKIDKKEILANFPTQRWIQFCQPIIVRRDKYEKAKWMTNLIKEKSAMIFSLFITSWQRYSICGW